MANRLLISYDLITPGQQYDDIYTYMEKFMQAKSPLESVWVVKTKKEYSEVRDELRDIVDENDKILVVDITNSTAAWHNISSSDWIKNKDV